MQKCNCNQCGADIEIADEINFVTCRSCQTPLKIQRTEYVVYTETIKNQLISPVTQQDNLQNEAKQAREQAQAELQLTYQKLAALNDEWKGKYPDYAYINNNAVPLGTVNSKDAKHNRAAFAVIFILLGLSALVGGIWLLGVKDESMIEGIVTIVVGICFIIIGPLGFTDNAYINDRKIYEQKKAEIEAQVAELEQKIR